MKKIDFTQVGGYPLKQETFARMQDGYFEILKALITSLGIPENGSFIISGCNTDGFNIAPGLMYIDGDLCTFAGSASTENKISKLVTTQNLPFRNGSNLPVFITTTAVIDGVAGTPITAFSRVNLVFDANYVHTDVNFTQALFNKLIGIEALAQKNVQADWNETNPGSDSFIKNKINPAIVLWSHTADIGDILGEDQIKTVSFPDVGTDNYHPVVTVMSHSNGIGGYEGWNVDNDISWVVTACTSTSFKIGFRDWIGAVQNLKVKYTLLKIN